MKAPKAVRQDLVNLWSILVDPWTHEKPCLDVNRRSFGGLDGTRMVYVVYQVLILIYWEYNIYIHIYTVYRFAGGGLNTFSEDIWKHYKSMNGADFYETLSIFEYQVKLDYTRYVPGNSMQNCHE